MAAPKNTAPTLMASRLKACGFSSSPTSFAPNAPKSALRKPRYAGALSSTLDKALSKKILTQAGIPNAKFTIMRTGKERLPRSLSFPVIVKPVAEGSRKGVHPTSVVDNESELREAAREMIAKYEQPALVEEVTLRSTRLRSFNGFVHYVPNGEFKMVTNRSREWNRLTVDVPVGANQDLGRALQLCREVVDRLNAEPAWRGRLLEPAELWGVESLIGSEVQLRMVVRSRPGADAFQVARELRLRCHDVLVAGQIRTGTSREIAITPLSAGPVAAVATATPRENP